MLYIWIKAILRFVYRLLFRLEVKGIEVIPKQGAVVLCANHISVLDPPAVGIMLNRSVHFMAKAELFQIPILGSIIRALKAFPVKRNAVGKETIRTAVSLLREGNIIGIFPEGTRNVDGVVAAKKGAALIALKSEATIIPVAIVGKYLIFHKTKIVYGAPIDISDLLTQKSGALDIATQRIMNHIYRILHEETGNRN